MDGNNQQAYDRGTSLFSPDGRIYQVEYAREAVSRGAPSVGIRADDGVIFAAMSRASSSLMEPESIEKLHKLDDHLGTASAGHVADARQLIDFAREQSQVSRLRYGEPVGVEDLTKSVTDKIQENTQLGGTRPFGAALLIGGIDEGQPRLFGADPSGTPNEWRATVIGGGREEIQSLLEDEWEEGLEISTALSLAVRALRQHDEELSSKGLSISTVTSEEGYRDLTDEEVTDAVAEANGHEGGSGDEAGE